MFIKNQNKFCCVSLKICLIWSGLGIRSSLFFSSHFQSTLLFLKTDSLRFALCCSLKKSDHEWISLVALYKRATMSKLLTSLFTKEWWERIARIFYCSFHHVFDNFFSFLCLRANRSCLSSLLRSFAHKKTSNLPEKPKTEFPTLDLIKNLAWQKKTFSVVVLSPSVL